MAGAYYQHGSVVWPVVIVSCQAFCSGSASFAGRGDIYHRLSDLQGFPCDVRDVGNVSAEQLVGNGRISGWDSDSGRNRGVGSQFLHRPELLEKEYKYYLKKERAI